MPHYLVRIELQIGEYEKDTNFLVEAPDSDLAEVFACPASRMATPG